MRTILRTTAVIGGLVLATGAASANPETNPIELGGALGGHAFAADAELGVADQMDEPGPATSGLVGLRVGYQALARLAAEGELMVIPTEDDVVGDAATVYGLRAHARFDLLTGKLRPFVVAGIGLHVVRGGGPQIANDTDRAYHWGGGVRYAISPRLDVRVDLRHLIVPDRTVDGATSDFESTLGVTYKLGGKRAKAAAPRVAAAPMIVLPPKPGDSDGDGVLDNVDQCLWQPEDLDGFEDLDGCVDADNDRDGIVDTSDRCPLVQETRNGWQDDDGCPDQVIAELTGIGFETDSWKIDGASGPLLDRAFLILMDNPQLEVEIAGHTSSEGDAARNLELSLRRAQAVKEYLVKRGVPAGRLGTVGHGADVPIGDNRSEDGRRKNRRIEFRVLRAK